MMGAMPGGPMPMPLDAQGNYFRGAPAYAQQIAPSQYAAAAS